MKKIISIILLLPLFAFSQQHENKKPMTPYADIGFEDGKVVYTIENAKLNFSYGLLPKMYDRRLLQIRYNNTAGNFSGKYMAGSQKAIREYVNTEPAGQLSAREQTDYLKLCALLIIWDSGLGDHAAKELDKLAASKNGEIKRDAGLVRGLLGFYSEHDRGSFK